MLFRRTRQTYIVQSGLIILLLRAEGPQLRPLTFATIASGRSASPGTPAATSHPALPRRGTARPAQNSPDPPRPPGTACSPPAASTRNSMLATSRVVANAATP